MKQQSIEERLAELTATGLPDRDNTKDMLTTGVRRNNKVISEIVEGFDFETGISFAEYLHRTEDSKIAFGGPRENAGLSNDEKIILACVTELATKKGSQRFTATREELEEILQKKTLIKKGDKNRTRDVNAILEEMSNLNGKSVYIYQGGYYYTITTVLTIKERQHHIFTGKLKDVEIELGSWIDIKAYNDHTPSFRQCVTLVATLAKWVDVGITIYLLDLIKKCSYKFETKTPYINITWENLANIAGLARSLKKNPSRTKDELFKECQEALKLQQSSMKGEYAYQVIRIKGKKDPGVRIVKMGIQ